MGRKDIAVYPRSGREKYKERAIQVANKKEAQKVRLFTYRPRDSFPSYRHYG